MCINLFQTIMQGKKGLSPLVQEQSRKDTVPGGPSMKRGCPVDTFGD